MKIIPHIFIQINAQNWCYKSTSESISQLKVGKTKIFKPGMITTSLVELSSSRFKAGGIISCAYIRVDIGDTRHAETVRHREEGKGG